MCLFLNVWLGSWVLWPGGADPTVWGNLVITGLYGVLQAAEVITKWALVPWKKSGRQQSNWNEPVLRDKRLVVCTPNPLIPHPTSHIRTQKQAVHEGPSDLTREHKSSEPQILRGKMGRPPPTLPIVYYCGCQFRQKAGNWQVNFLAYITVHTDKQLDTLHISILQGQSPGCEEFSHPRSSRLHIMLRDARGTTSE